MFDKIIIEIAYKVPQSILRVLLPYRCFYMFKWLKNNLTAFCGVLMCIRGVLMKFIEGVFIKKYTRGTKKVINILKLKRNMFGAFQKN